jgi:hypothetical protein
MLYRPPGCPGGTAPQTGGNIVASNQAQTASTAQFDINTGSQPVTVGAEAAGEVTGVPPFLARP